MYCAVFAPRFWSTYVSVVLLLQMSNVWTALAKEVDSADSILMLLRRTYPRHRAVERILRPFLRIGRFGEVLS